MRTRTLTLLTLALALPIATAADLGFDAGATGRCHDADGSGAAARLVATDDEPVPDDMPGNVVNAVTAVVTFVNDPTTVPSGNGCTGTSETDYVEAHVFVDVNDDGSNEVPVEVCYAGTTSDLDGPCYPAAP